MVAKKSTPTRHVCTRKLISAIVSWLIWMGGSCVRSCKKVPCWAIIFARSRSTAPTN